MPRDQGQCCAYDDGGEPETLFKPSKIAPGGPRTRPFLTSSRSSAYSPKETSRSAIVSDRAQGQVAGFLFKLSEVGNSNADWCLAVWSEGVVGVGDRGRGPGPSKAHLV